MIKLWKWLRELSNNKIKEEYMNRVHHDRFCTNCKTWTSEIGGCVKIEYSDCGWFEFMTCKKCSHVSKWDCRGMLPTLVEDD